MGARPRDSSSMHSTLAARSSALASASCCCSPPDMFPALDEAVGETGERGKHLVMAFSCGRRLAANGHRLDLEVFAHRHVGEHSTGLSRRWARMQNQWRTRRPIEIEVCHKVAKLRRVFAHIGSGIGPTVGSAVETLPAHEVVLDEL